MEVFVHDGKNLLLKVVDYHVVEEPTDCDEIGLRGFDVNFLDK